MRRLVKLLLVDAVLLGGLVIGAAVSARSITAFISERLHISPAWANLALIAGVGVLAGPFVVGVLRIARRLGMTLAEAALPKTESGTVDLAAAPRRVLLVTLQLGVVLVVALPLLAFTQPFLPGLPAAVVAGILLVVKLVPPDLMAEFRVTATSHQGERALGKRGAAVIVFIWIAGAVIAALWLWS